MAVVSIKSGNITNRDASPKVLNKSFYGGNLKNSAGAIETNADDSIGSTYVFCSIPSNARVSKVLLSCDAVTSGAMDIGIYKNTLDSNAVVDADAFASAQSIASALKNSDVTYESGIFGVEDIEKPLWEVLGLTSDPGLLYDIVGTLTAATTAAGSVALQVDYAV